MKALFRVSFVLLLTSALVWAGDFWEDKEFTQWSEKDVKKMMTNSPWAKQVNVALSMGARGGRVVGGAPGRRGGRDSGGGRPGRGGGGIARRPAVRLTISWRSALPVKQALVKARMGDSTEMPAGAQQYLNQQDEFYILAVAGFPAQMAGRLVRNREAVLAATVLKRKSDSISPENVRAFERGDAVDVLFFFPRSAGITLEDKDVELVAELGPMEIKKKFKLKDMVLNGKLEL